MFVVETLLATSSAAVLISDVCTRKISNKLSALVLISCLLLSFTNENISLHFAQSAMVFAVGLVLFSAGIIGAGDIKVLCCYSLIIDNQYWLLSIVIIGFLGGITALVILIKIKIIDSYKNEGVPYGLPIVITSLFFIHLSTII
ncbi:A24 family peptidase [Enterovibrio sp. ZSDZ35]|uniref:A24 family peptidase n=1 Tax=Enterovibrio qingdaonensis TaxID=2899818 RepID=A0ABT5QL81_9GAMM|nr:prepilin peptidase [Enterovibrio sp. ZSDZ35]MDD1781733.1 A24 family peptidase [Enterovibrio sp. ZSDZ35]